MPDIPTAASGQYLQRFGQQLQNFGGNLQNALLNLQGQTGKAMYNGIVAQEVTAAKRMAYERLNEFNFRILSGENTDYKSYLPAWADYQAKTLKEAKRRMTVQEAKDEFSEFWTQASQTYAVQLTEKAAAGLVGEAEATAVTAIAEAARQGNEPGVLDHISTNAKRQGWASSYVRALALEYVPQARYNNVLNTLDALGDTDAAIEILNRSDADSVFSLPSDGDKSIESLRGYFEEKGASIREGAQRKRVADAAKVYTDIGKKWDDGSITGPELRAALGQVGETTYQTAIKGMLDKYNALYARGADVIKEREQTAEFYTLQNSLYAWRRGGRQGDAPWSPEALLAKFQNTKLSETQMKTLRDDWEKADEPDAVVGFRSRIFGAMIGGTGKPQALQWTSMQLEIDASYGTGNLRTEEHRSLLSDLLQAKGEYEKGLNRTEEQFEIDAASIVYSKTMDVAAKLKWLEDNKGHFSGDDYSKWHGRVSEYNDDPNRKQVMDALDAFFGRAAQGENVTETRKRELTIEEYYAKETLEKLFIANPSDPAKWNEALNTLLTNQALRDLEDAVEKKLGGQFPATAGVPEFRRLDILEAGREQSMELDLPQLAAQRAMSTSAIQEREEALAKAKIGRATITSRSIDSESGETLFYGDNGMVYYVETTRGDDKRLRRTVYGAKVGATDWSVVGRE